MHLETASAEKTCASCSAPLTQKRGWQRFCSAKCRNDYHNLPRRIDAMAREIAALKERLKVLEGKCS